jgi:tripartite-type tricarboxylate transporter receptor subunit TctC
MARSGFRLSRRTLIRTAVASAATTGIQLAFGVEAQPYRIIVGFSPGGGADIVARLMASAITTVSNHRTIVENRAGAGGRIAIMAVKAAERDPNTMFFGSTSVLTLFPYVFKDLPYALEHDYTPVSTCCSFPYAIVVSPTIGVSDLKGLAEWARAHRGKAFFGTPGVGTPQHLIGSLLGHLMGTPLEHVAFKSGSEATQMLLSGQIPIVLATAGQFYALHRTGQVRMVATTGAHRPPSMKDVPTCAEAGFPGLVFEDSFGFIAPAKISGEASASLQEHIAQAMHTAVVEKGLASQDMQPLLIQGAAYEKYLQDEKKRWASTVATPRFAPSAS